MYYFIGVLSFFMVCFLKNQINEWDTNENKEENIIEKRKYPVGKDSGIPIIAI
jgi:hypothetical protein